MSSIDELIKGKIVDRVIIGYDDQDSDDNSSIEIITILFKPEHGIQFRAN
jgi:hypothetical protein